MMKKLPMLLCVAAGFVGAVLLLELTLRLLPVGGKGVYADDPRPDWPAHHLVPNGRYVHSSGWNFVNVRRGQINNLGYVAPFDYLPGSKGIVVLGDSFVEGLQNDYGDTIQGSLPRYLASPQQVMQFGNSAASLADYLGLAPLIAERFRPTWATVVVISGDFEEGFAANDGYFRWNPDSDPPVDLVPERAKSTLVKWMRQLALTRYLRYNLKIVPARLIERKHAPSAEQRVSECAPVRLSSRNRELVERVADELPKALSLDPSHVVLVFDSDRASIYSPNSPMPCPTDDAAALSLLGARAQALGMHVIDTQPLFTDFYRRTGQRLDYSPVDMHWNKIAHGLVARRIAEIINR
jgi:hypothetical protein